jgi:hypothetical protein
MSKLNEPARMDAPKTNPPPPPLSPSRDDVRASTSIKVAPASRSGAVRSSETDAERSCATDVRPLAPEVLARVAVRGVDPATWSREALASIGRCSIPVAQATADAVSPPAGDGFTTLLLTAALSVDRSIATSAAPGTSLEAARPEPTTCKPQDDLARRA